MTTKWEWEWESFNTRNLEAYTDVSDEIEVFFWNYFIFFIKGEIKMRRGGDSDLVYYANCHQKNIKGETHMRGSEIEKLKINKSFDVQKKREKWWFGMNLSNMTTSCFGFIRCYYKQIRYFNPQESWMHVHINKFYIALLHSVTIYSERLHGSLIFKITHSFETYAKVLEKKKFRQRVFSVFLCYTAEHFSSTFPQIKW